MTQEQTFPAGIVIATRNREDDLRKLFDLLASQPAWASLPIWLHDDASDKVSDGYFEWLRRHCFRVIQSGRRQGYIACRNSSNSSAPFRYIFSMDDDSCFTAPDGPGKAVDFLDANPDVVALSFPLVGSPLETNGKSGRSPEPCGGFVGCAHAVRQETFKQLGGYRTDFVHQGEEGEYARRVWRSGFKVMTFPACPIYHWASATSRDWKRMGFFGPRNRVFTHILSTPFTSLPGELLRTAGSYLKLSAKTGLAHIHALGYAAGLRAGVSHWSDRLPLTRPQYRAFRKLPPDANAAEPKV